MPFLVHTLLVAPTLPGAWVTCKRGRCSPAVAGAFAALTVAIGLVIIMLVFRWYEVRIPAYGEAAKSSNPREQHEVVLVAFPPCGALASSTSHACAKVEAYLRFAGIPFKKENGSPDRAPRKAVRTTGPFSPRRSAALRCAAPLSSRKAVQIKRRSKQCTEGRTLPCAPIKRSG